MPTPAGSQKKAIELVHDENLEKLSTNFRMPAETRMELLLVKRAAPL